MSDSPGSTPQPTPPPLPPGSGWYQGPFPPPGWHPKPEPIWRALLRRSLTAIVVMAVVFICIFGMGACVGALISAATDDDDTPKAAKDLDTEFHYGDHDSDNELLSIPITGVILGEKPDISPLFNLVDATYGYEVKEILRKAARDNDIKGVVLELSTPGGTIFGSQAIADAVKEYQEATGNPVLAFVAGLSASGGMWSMAPADRILADYGSLVGSIGVILGPFQFYNGVVATEGGILGGGVTTTGGITQEYITGGRSKDVGNPYRPLTQEERDVLQAGVNSIYDDFVAHVASNREIPEDRIRNEMGALIFANEQAQAFGLIDGTATREAAYAELANMAGINSDDWQIVREDKGGGFADLFAKLDAQGQEALAKIIASQVCFTPTTALAYYGDPSGLCR